MSQKRIKQDRKKPEEENALLQKKLTEVGAIFGAGKSFAGNDESIPKEHHES